MLETIRQDVKYAVRSLVHTPGFTITAVLTLALGIAATTAIFSVFDVVLLRPLPYPGAERLHVVHEGGRRPIPVNALHFREWRTGNQTFEELALLGGIPVPLTLRGAGDPAPVEVARATPNLFAMLGAEPALGRTFLDEETVEGNDRVVVLGHDVWRTRFGADPSVIGRTVALNGEPNVIVGVLPERFSPPKLSHLYAVAVTQGAPQVWIPFAPTESDLRLLGRYNNVAIGRLKPGVSPAQATDDLNVIQASLAKQAPEPTEFRAGLVPLGDQIASGSRAALQILFSAVGVVLLIACVNITNLLLARAVRRDREFAIRRAAGADRSRLVIQLATESLVLATVAGVAGIAVGAALIQVVVTAAPVDLPRVDEVVISARVLLFAFAVTLGTAFVVGFAPAVHAARDKVADLLRASSSPTVTTKRHSLARSILVGAEVAGGAVCLIAGAFLLNSFINLMSVERGFDSSGVITVAFALPPRYDTAQGAAFVTRLAERARTLPGVVSAGVTDMLPLRGVSNSGITLEGSNVPRSERPSAMIRFADAGYFETMGMTLAAGRLLNDRDAGLPVAVISSLAATRFWPGQDPLGRRFRHGADDSPFVEVVGVVNDVRAVSLPDDPPSQIYRTAADYFYGPAALVVKTSGQPTALAPALQQLVRNLDPEFAVPTPQTMDDIVATSIAPRRFQMNLMLLLAGAAVFLAGIGIYGVVSQTVLQRTGEYGIRMALGARVADILRLVLQRALRPVVAGLAIGIVASIAASGLLRSLLFGMTPGDIRPFAAASAFLLGVAVLAALVPARRATRVNPVEALRME